MDEKEPLISIIVPVYNVEDYIEECLESLVKQTYKNLEIILIDDGSTDNSGKICDDYVLKDTRIKCFLLTILNPSCIVYRLYNGLFLLTD